MDIDQRVTQTGSPGVSIIIPAYNAAATLGQTLDSLLAQTYPAWEAIVVDDGSSDGTLELAQHYSLRDGRIRVISGKHHGVSAARNAAIHPARFEWLAFLDADDWVDPNFLHSMTQALSADPGLDAVHCGWARLAPGGDPVLQRPAAGSGLLFDRFMQSCYFPINACVVRKELVLAVQGFDPTLTTCEDWDLWLRLARAGARFGAVSHVLAFYRTRPDSASADARQLLRDAFRVLERAHSRDDRLPYQHPDYPTDLPPRLLLARKYQFLCWCAGLSLVAGEDARLLFEVSPLPACPELEVSTAIDYLVASLQATGCASAGTPYEFWVGLWPRVQDFLAVLQHQAQAPNLVAAGSLRLLRLALQGADQFAPLSFGPVHALRLELTKPLSDLHFPDQINRSICRIELAGSRLGSLELPVFDGFVPGDLLADALAAEYAWVILDRFFRATLYTEFDTRRDPEGISVWRGEVCLAVGLDDGPDSIARQLHSRAGWTLFLQEFWGIRDRPQSWFYDPQAQEVADAAQAGEDGWCSLELSDALPDVTCPLDTLHVVVSLAGVIIAVVALPVIEGRVSAHTLRAAISRECGFELCRAAVREALLGASLVAGGSLRQRLSQARQRAAETPLQLPELHMPENVAFAGAWGKALARALHSVPAGGVLPRFSGTEVDTGFSRRAVFPEAAYPDLVAAADQTGASLVYAACQPGQPIRGIYAPDLIVKEAPRRLPPNPTPLQPQRLPHEQDDPHGRPVFEAIFAEKTDPWQYTNLYEQIKYQQSLELLPERRYPHALEIGCAEGHFTIQLAPHCDSLLAADISRVALQRAAQRCTGLENVQFLPLDLSRDPLPGQFDLIVCSEILYYTGGREVLPTIAHKLSDALLPGGLLLMAHAHLVVDDPAQTGFNWDHPFGASFIARTFQQVRQLHLIKELRTPLYRIQLFQRKSRFSLPFSRKRPQITSLAEQPAPPPPGADLQVLWQGGQPQRSETRLVETDRLPILLYHRIAPRGSSQLMPYRVSPREFEEQIRYLRDSGHYGVTIEEWHAAMKDHRPLPGRAVLITFDDGYRDFKEYAWPILQLYGFSALVFLVAGNVGGSNSWDRLTGETLPLLDWDEIRDLEEAGVRFGSHSNSHPLMTALPPAEILREAFRSRTLLSQHLAAPLRSFAYPYGGEDPVVRHLIGASGFTYGFTCRAARCSLWDPLLGLPRIEVSGTDRFEDFVRKLT